MRTSNPRSPPAHSRARPCGRSARRGPRTCGCPRSAAYSRSG
ncbi:hypothetical protein MGSAQ_002370 [marine sediment metagenome]|uniref:Uncharacterized protein n=1 Tax=marine sediment metagenome TaxID=412755 RepID=A0A1B6NRP4_9ZZZZ